MPGHPAQTTADAVPVWARAVIAVASVLAAFAWLAAWGLYAIGTAPSGSPSENMNGVVLLLLPLVVGPATLLTTFALVLGSTFARSRTARTIMLGSAALVIIGVCAFVASAM